MENEKELLEMSKYISELQLLNNRLIGERVSMDMWKIQQNIDKIKEIINDHKFYLIVR